MVFDEETRRQIEAQLGPKVMQHPYVKRMRQNIQEAGIAATEVYRLNGATPEQHRYFDVYTMKKWTEENAQLVGTWLDWKRAEHLIRSGAVDPDRIRDHTMNHTMDPVIVGVRAFENGSDAILDGAHRYVAYALKGAEAGRVGMPLPMPAYFLEPDQWQQFLIPDFIAKAMCFDDSYANDAHKWMATA